MFSSAGFNLQMNSAVSYGAHTSFNFAIIWQGAYEQKKCLDGNVSRSDQDLTSSTIRHKWRCCTAKDSLILAMYAVWQLSKLCDNTDGVSLTNSCSVTGQTDPCSFNGLKEYQFWSLHKFSLTDLPCFGNIWVSINDLKESYPVPLANYAG